MRPARTLVFALCLLVVAASVPLPVAAHVNHVAADPQVSPDGTLVVESAFIASDGFLAVQRDDDGAPGEVLGHVPLAAGDGFVTELRVDIDAEAWADWGDTRTVHLVLRNDDGDGTFEPSQDTVVSTFGRPAESVVPVAKGERAVVSARSFSPQRTASGTITVRYAALPSDGHVVVENASDGTVLGTTALDAGEHTNVSVALSEESLDRERLRVETVLYRDDGDGTFGEGDEPFAVGGERVATGFTVRPSEGNDTATATDSLVTTATPFPSDGSTATETDEPTATEGQPGLGVLAGVAALLAVGLLLRRVRP